MFIIVFILYYFDLECCIWIEINTCSNTISEIIILLISNNLHYYYLIVSFFRKIIIVKTWYKTNNSKLLAFFESFKAWLYYLKI